MEPVDFAQPADKVQLSSGPIEKLPDDLLAKVFSYLPFSDRYKMCLVSSKWAAASRIPWTGITFLNLSSIPQAMVNPVLALCPKVEVIEATDLVLLLEKRQGLSIHANVHTMKLRNTKLALPGLYCDDAEPSFGKMRASFYDHFERFPKLAELILDNVTFTALQTKDGATSKPSFHDFGSSGMLALPDQTATSFRRLVLTNSSVSSESSIDVALNGMLNVECIYLGRWQWSYLCWNYCASPQLRELRVIDVGGFSALVDKVVGNKFPNLAVLICSSDRCLNPASLCKLITAKLALRVLVIAGRDERLDSNRCKLDLEQQFGILWSMSPSFPLPITLPAPPRKFLPIANAEIPSPLHIFVGGNFIKHVRFTLPPSDVANFWRIDCPMPEYLAKPEVAEVFEGVFVAKIIREGPAWGHPNKMELFFSTEPLLFN